MKSKRVISLNSILAHRKLQIELFIGYAGVASLLALIFFYSVSGKNLRNKAAPLKLI